MNNSNEMTVEFKSIAQNESFARMVVAAFITETNPTLEEVADIKTSVSEAVTNSIIHGYENSEGLINIKAKTEGRNVTIWVADKGKGIPDIEKAMEPMYTTRADEDRSGLGFSFMEALMDGIDVTSSVGEGTTVKMWKEIGATGHHFD